MDVSSHRRLREDLHLKLRASHYKGEYRKRLAGARRSEDHAFVEQFPQTQPRGLGKRLDSTAALLADEEDMHETTAAVWKFRDARAKLLRRRELLPATRGALTPHGGTGLVSRMAQRIPVFQ